jgi:hypothetical protein
MSSDERRMALVHEIQAWREALVASEPGSLRHRKFQNKMKLAAWELQALGPSQESPGVVIKVVEKEE